MVMNEQVLWVWNGWGVLLTCLIAVWTLLHCAVTLKLGPWTPIRNWIAWIPLVCVPMTFVLSGWIAGLLALPIGCSFALILARPIVLLYRHE